MTTLHEFALQAADGRQQALADYAGKVVLLVNTASECGYTPQYAGLEVLHRQYAAGGLVLLGVPCNQFGAQEPGTAEQIAEFCHARFGVSFALLGKQDVNGEQAAPLWRWLTRAGSEFAQPVKWNFTKFLFDRHGRLVKRYEPAVEPAELAPDIEQLLQASG